MIPRNEWEWCGEHGHLVGLNRCFFRLHTRVGAWRISTVGEYFPNSDTIQKSLSGFADDHFYETMVFQMKQVAGEWEVDSWTEVERDFASTRNEAQRMHMRMCEKYAKA